MRPQRLREAIRRAIRRLRPRTLGAVLTVAIAFQLWLLVEIRDIYPTMSAGETYLSGTIINLIMTFCIAFATLVADETVELGARRFPAYAWAVVVGAAFGTLLQWQAHRWLHVIPVNLDVPTPNPVYDVAGRLHVEAVEVTQPAVMFFEFLIWGSIFVFIYVERRGALQASQRMAAAHVARTRAQRRTLQSRLQALQARVEPQFLFNTLSQVRNLYDEDSPRGGRMLSDLIAYLRAALPHLRESDSTLGQELQLATAYLRIVHEHAEEAFALDVDVPRDVLAARVPAMVLLPMIDHVLAASSPKRAGSTAIRVAARASDGRLHVELTFDDRLPAPARDDLPSDIRGRLQGLYGQRSRLRLEPSGTGTRLLMELPLDAADGDSR